MAKGNVCLSFDFDAVSLWMSRDMLTPTPVSRGEFGAVAVPRILNLLADRDIVSTWFIPGHTVESYPEVCKEIVEAGHEVALHGYAHENVASLPEEKERDVFRRSHELVGALMGSAPRGFRAPAWDLSSHTIEIMLELGLSYDSSLMSHDYAVFYCRTGDKVLDDTGVQFGETTDLVELPISWTLDDYPHFEYLRMQGLLMPGLRSPDAVFKNWTGDIEYMLRDFEDGVVTVTFHPQVIGRGHRLLGLERWIDELKEMELKFSRMDSIAESFMSGKSFGRYKPQSARNN